MFKENEIQLYKTKINFKRVIDEYNLQETEESVFVCDLNDLRTKYEMWRKLMPRVKPYYAVKCNDDDYVIKTLAGLGINFECASKREMKQVLNLDVGPERIIFGHPYKIVAHVDYAKENGVMTTVVDTECEIYKMHKYYPEANLILRIRCDAKNAVILFGDKFGCDPETEATSLMHLAKNLNLKIIGICFHVGTGCNDLPVYDRAITFAKNLFNYGSALGFDMHLLDIGGGFPGNDYGNFKNLSDIINTSLMRNFPDDKVNIIAEPGRYFVFSAYTLICKIHAKRETFKPNGKLLTKQYYLNDGVYTSFNSVITEDAHVNIQHFVNEENVVVPKFNSILWGPTCDSLDKIAQNRQLPDLQCGDFLVFPNMGAYSLPLACRFNGFMSPKVLYFDKSIFSTE